MAYLIAKFLLSVFYAQEVYMTEVCWSKNYRDNGEDPSGGGAYDSTGISDVIEVIQEIDPDFSEPSGEPTRRPQPAPMFNDLGQVPVTSQPPHHSSGTHKSKPNAEVIITEQPASKALRFRYECEGRSAGSIPGASSTPENKTFPTIQVVGYRGRAVVVASCVTKDSPYMVHPHNLVGKEGCKKGVCTLMISPDTMTAQFQNLGIQCVKKRDIESSLRQREQIRVDPFKAGYNHKNQPIDLNAVRLCFQVFLEADKTGKFTVPLRPVVSDVIYDKKAMSDLTIIKLSDCVSHVDGGRKDIIILCEKVAKEDIEVHFYEESAKKVRVWEAKADFQPSQVHKQHAIWFRPPRYHTLDITEPVKVFIQLYRPSDHVTSEPVPFQFLPLESENYETSNKRKRAKIDQSRDKILSGLTERDKRLMEVLGNPMEPIKTEPLDTATPQYGGTSPYGGGFVYQGSPNYVPSPAMSPYLAPTPSPESMNYPYRHQSVNVNNEYNIMPIDIKPDPVWNIPAQQSLQMSWNVPSTSTDPPPHILDLDDHRINSGDLQSHLNSILPTGQLPEFQNLSLTDIEINSQNVSMSDSLTNIVNEAAAKI